ncbi:hypothetical protein EPN95_01005 [Patescibacteria group bacterium]|nr:MAG: hypothetical protein EPN95_01005 [Patescibacteria group bacterium]
MDKDLDGYEKQTAHRIDIIDKKLGDASATERAKLIKEAQIMYDYHTIRVRDFQNERLVHLLVTFFFAGLWLLSAAGGLYVLTLAADPSGPMLNILAWTLCPLLLLTELFYVRHYYKLENGTQALYKLTKRLHTIIKISIEN